MLKSIKLSQEKLDENYKLMRKGNTYLKMMTDMVKMEKRPFRAKLFKIGYNYLDWPQLTEDQHDFFQMGMPHIKAVRNIETEMISAFYALVNKHVRAWIKRANGTIADYDDYLQEALLALLDSIYSYTEENVAFTTYAWHVIHNRMSNVANVNNPFPLTHEAMVLLAKYEKAVDKSNRYVTDYDIFELCGFNEDEIAIVRDAKVKVYGASQIDFNDTDNASNDYTEIRRGINNEKDTVPCNYELHEAIERAGLTPLERRCIDASMYPYVGWQEDIAKTTINHNTGKRYTRARIGQVLDIAKNKVKVSYMRRQVA